jgi:hypothetical protein
MFPLNTILAWNINIIMNKKYDNNNIIIASRAYFLQGPLAREVQERYRRKFRHTNEGSTSGRNFGKFRCTNEAI